MNDLISRQNAIDAVLFGITYAKAINKDTGEVMELFKQGNEELTKAVDRINELPSAQRWIPVSERLPEKFQTCIVTDELRQCAYEYDYNPENEFTKKYGWRYQGRKIIAWMPLPEPYKGES